ncbi:hypothetical protein ACWGDS_48475 [Streptomyces sp. NPDC055059]|uniref:Uncharacterized protein n=1 Tax=Streptomyces sp. NBC_00119 TaxID=2975659 RepID=A0AAU1ULJ1_9ACTN|nr:MULTISPECIES: hypothetical protein [unclassified Streptomyces]MCX4649554.1 hypothetical protein [Streptomyces sp. NBC_01446]MCX5321241.1 hypothetical protein [Streptomyces sp. NBC_00120]
MFEDYAGTSDSGFRAKVEAEQALERGEHLLALPTHHQHDLRGPAADEAAVRLTEFRQRADFAGAVVTDPHRLRRVLGRHDPKVYPGTYVTCVFNPDKALCQPRAAPTGERQRPAPPECQPLQCRNVALTVANAAALAPKPIISTPRRATALPSRPFCSPTSPTEVTRSATSSQ